MIAVKRSIANSHGLKSSDPVHDILMELYVADHENRPMSVSAAAVMAGLAPTTALRWLGIMIDGGLIVRRGDPADGRRAWLTLTDATKARIDAVLGSGAGRIR